MAGSGWDASTAGLGVEVSTDLQTITRPTSGGGANYAGVKGLTGRSKGKRYFEIEITTGSIGAADSAADVTGMLGGGTAISWGYLNVYSVGYIYFRYPNGDSGTIDTGGATGSGVYGILIDFDNRTAKIYKDGAFQYTHTMNIPVDTELFPAASIGTGASATLNTAEPFQYPPEETFIAWDLPDSALASRISGLVEIEGQPAARTLKAFTFERLTYYVDGQQITESKPLGQTVSDATTGQYEIILRKGFPREVFVVAFDDYGNAFSAGVSVQVGDRIHPSAPNGYIYDCTGSGTLPETEPVWSQNTESDQLVGTASFRPKPFYRPMVHGPVSPEVLVLFLDEFFDSVVLLSHFDGVTNDTLFPSVAGPSFTAFNGAQSWPSGKFGKGVSMSDGAYLSAGNDAAFAFGGSDFTLEIFFNPSTLDNFGHIISTGDLSDDQLSIRHSNAGKIQVYSGSGSGSGVLNIQTGTTTLTTDRFWHLAVTRKNGVTRVFLDGEIELQVSATYTCSAQGPLKLGDQGGHTGPVHFNGIIDEFRFTVGVARYTAAFQVPPEAYPDYGPV